MHLPERFLPVFPSPMYLVNRLGLGDVTQGKLVAPANDYGLFNGILTPRQEKQDLVTYLRTR